MILVIYGIWKQKKKNKSFDYKVGTNYDELFIDNNSYKTNEELLKNNDI